MGINKFQLMTGRVMHKRLFPKINAFNYGIYYISLPLNHLYDMPISYNKFSITSFYDTDHGARDGGNLDSWARNILTQNGVPEFDGEITLKTMPRLFGYVFNPVSFWLCHDKDRKLIAYLCEVNNTFGETHTYICKHNDNHPIEPSDILIGEKVFHVSPFLKRKGQYHFLMSDSDTGFNAKIDFYDEYGKKQLVTALNGQYTPMTHKNLRATLLRHPFLAIKAISLIHWQALKLLLKGIGFIHKPIQNKNRITKTKN